MKFIHYVLDTQGELRIPAIAEPKPSFASAEEAVQAALTWETEVTGQINQLMNLCVYFLIPAVPGLQYKRGVQPRIRYTMWSIAAMLSYTSLKKRCYFKHSSAHSNRAA